MVYSEMNSSNRHMTLISCIYMRSCYGLHGDFSFGSIRQKFGPGWSHSWIHETNLLHTSEGCCDEMYQKFICLFTVIYIAHFP